MEKSEIKSWVRERLTNSKSIVKLDNCGTQNRYWFVDKDPIVMVQNSIHDCYNQLHVDWKFECEFLKKFLNIDMNSGKYGNSLPRGTKAKQILFYKTIVQVFNEMFDKKMVYSNDVYYGQDWVAKYKKPWE